MRSRLPIILTTLLLLAGCATTRPDGNGVAVCDCSQAVRVPDSAFEADASQRQLFYAIAPQSQTITSVDGIPTTLLLDPRGRMKCTYNVASDGIATFGPTDIRNITVPVTELDYNKVDTISFLPKVCTPDGKCN